MAADALGNPNEHDASNDCGRCSHCERRRIVFVEGKRG